MALGKCRQCLTRGVLGHSEFCAVYWKAKKHGTRTCEPSKGGGSRPENKPRGEGAMPAVSPVGKPAGDRRARRMIE